MEPYFCRKHIILGLLLAFLVSIIPGMILEYSRFNSYHPLSVREEQLAELRNYVWGEQGYIVVTGAKGVGKSCLINSFISEMGGVVECIVPPGTDQEAIVNKALRAITKFPMPDYLLLEYSAKWAISAYKLVYQKSPVLVIRASERTANEMEPYAKLTGAVRTLTENYGLHVIVDGSPNAVNPGLLQTRRQDIINIEPYDYDALGKIPEFYALFADLEDLGLKSTVWSVVGGFPDMYEKIRLQYSARAERDREGKLTEAGKKTLQNIVWKTLEGQIDEAIKTVGSATVKYNQMKTILELLDEKELNVPSAVLVSKMIERPDPDKVLREVFRSGERFLVPATPAIGLVIRHNFIKVPPREKLIELLK